MGMGQKKLAERSKVKPFIKGLKGAVANDTFKQPTQHKDAKKNIKKQLEERYTMGKDKWFYQPLRF
ncbi:60S ribosomal protein L27B [Stygiomarasmius scandens]|uniref:60S ribosomal protein L27B n=1 Tax=Marasmiellus scandens TaxID=2682957 RepID=A0ABR1J032_9AGAR